MSPREESGATWGVGLPSVKELPKFGRELRQGFRQVVGFIDTPAFQSLLTELRALPVASRHRFVRNVVLDDKELKKRGIRLPSEMIMQRSRFGDRRRNLFCVKKYIRPGLNVNVTFAPDVRIIGARA